MERRGEARVSVRQVQRGRRRARSELLAIRPAAPCSARASDLTRASVMEAMLEMAPALPAGT